jgi:hypothetical protein
VTFFFLIWVPNNVDVQNPDKKQMNPCEFILIDPNNLVMLDVSNISFRETRPCCF